MACCRGSGAPKWRSCCRLGAVKKGFLEPGPGVCLPLSSIILCPTPTALGFCLVCASPLIPQGPQRVPHWIPDLAPWKTIIINEHSEHEIVYPSTLASPTSPQNPEAGPPQPSFAFLMGPPPIWKTPVPSPPRWARFRLHPASTLGLSPPLCKCPVH